MEEGLFLLLFLFFFFFPSLTPPPPSRASQGGMPFLPSPSSSPPPTSALSLLSPQPFPLPGGGGGGGGVGAAGKVSPLVSPLASPNVAAVTFFLGKIWGEGGWNWRDMEREFEQRFLGVVKQGLQFFLFFFFFSFSSFSPSPPPPRFSCVLFSLLFLRPFLQNRKQKDNHPRGGWKRGGERGREEDLFFGG